MRKLRTAEVPRWLLGLLVVVVTGIAAAWSVWAAESTPRELVGAGIQEQLGAQVDLNLTFKDEAGHLVPLRSVVDGRKPVLLFLAYYECPNLCNMFLNGATEALKGLEWDVGSKFRIVTVSIDPREDSELAAGKRQAHLEAYAARKTGKKADLALAGANWHFWVNDTKAAADSESTHVKALARQVGFGYHYDKDQEQYAHSAAMIVLTPEGKVSRYLYGISFEPRDLKLALVEAGGRKIGSIVDHIMLYCYNYNPKTKTYSLYARNVMRAGGGLTVFLLGGILFGFWRRNRVRLS